jgi:hypothetical protein
MLEYARQLLCGKTTSICERYVKGVVRIENPMIAFIDPSGLLSTKEVNARRVE